MPEQSARMPGEGSRANGGGGSGGNAVSGAATEGRPYRGDLIANGRLRRLEAHPANDCVSNRSHAIMDGILDKAALYKGA